MLPNYDEVQVPVSMPAVAPKDFNRLYRVAVLIKVAVEPPQRGATGFQHQPCSGCPKHAGMHWLHVGHQAGHSLD